MFPYTSFSVLLLVICYSLLTEQVMMSFQDLELEVWLDDATFFASPKAADDVSGALCLDDIVTFDNGKAQTSFLQFSDADIFDGDWMDEKIDLSVFDSAQDLLPLVDDSDKSSSDACMLLDSIVDSDLLSDPPTFIDSPDSPSSIDSPVETYNSSIDHQYFREPSVSAETATSSVSMLPETGLQLPGSPACSVSSYNSTMSPSSVGGNTSDSDCNSSIFVEVLPDISYLSPELEDAKPQVKRPSGKDLSLLRKGLKAGSHPYLSAQPKKSEWRKERKKVQNKEAAARYRQKKQEEGKLLADEVAGLEVEQDKLQDKHDKLQAEVKYLKSLLREMFKARGVLK